jgi:hypothetical protein
MKYLGLLVAVMVASSTAPESPAQLKPVDHLSAEEVEAAVAAKPDVGFAFIEDAGFVTPSMCQAQMPSESVFTPTG